MKVEDGEERWPQRQHGEEQEVLATSTGYVKDVQKTLNGIRKTETRSRKLDQELEAVEAKWKQYQKELQAAFITERTKYIEKKAKIEKEVAENQQAKIEALKELQDIFSDPAKRQTSPDQEDRQGCPQGAGAAIAADGATRGRRNRRGYCWHLPGTMAAARRRRDRTSSRRSPSTRPSWRWLRPPLAEVPDRHRGHRRPQTTEQWMWTRRRQPMGKRRRPTSTTPTLSLPPSPRPGHLCQPGRAARDL